MEVHTVRVHTCIQEVEGFIKKKCRCRRFVPLDKAEEMVYSGDADRIVLSVEMITHRIECSLCGGVKPFIKSCANCNKQGYIEFKEPFLRRGIDIYMTSVTKTPRTPTIEKNHILRQFEDNKNEFMGEAIERIRIYGILNTLVLGDLGAQLRDPKTNEIILDGALEPEDNRQEGTGRRFDYGRSI